MNYSPDFGKTDKPDGAAGAKTGQRTGGRGADGKDAKESDWDGLRKDLDHVFNP